MGFRVLIIAVKGKDKGKILEEYKVESTGQFAEEPESPVNHAHFNGYDLLFINDKIEPNPDVFRALSAGASLWALYANETVMVSYSAHWEAGQKVWEVLHDCQEGITHLDAKGTLPAFYETSKAKNMKEQAEAEGVDYIFEVPVELFYDKVEYRHDISVEGLQWEILKRAPKSWWDIF